jgi:hypothetical protein
MHSFVKFDAQFYFISFNNSQLLITQVKLGAPDGCKMSRPRIFRSLLFCPVSCLSSLFTINSKEEFAAFEFCTKTRHCCCVTLLIGAAHFAQTINLRDTKS